MIELQILHVLQILESSNFKLAGGFVLCCRYICSGFTSVHVFYLVICSTYSKKRLQMIRSILNVQRVDKTGKE